MLLFAASGCAVLTLETVWLRGFRLLFGATAPAVSATLVAFFAGQALGAAWASRAVVRWRRPLRAYAALELAAAAGALAVPALLDASHFVMRAGYATLLESPGGLASLRFAIAALITLPATFCMGATLPAVGAAWLGRAGELGTRGSLLYGANLLGAAAGALLGAFVLPPRLGVLGSQLLAVATLAAVGAIALALDRSSAADGDATPATTPIESDETSPGLSPRARGALALLAGFGALALQVLLVRALSLVLDQSVYAFGAVLSAVLASLAIGAGGVSLLRAHTRVRVESALALALAVAGLGIAAFPAALRDLTGGFDPGHALAPGVALPAFALVAASAGIPLIATGALLPLLFASAGRDDAALGPGRPLGRLLALDTVGAIAGALAAPYLLLAAFELWSAFLVLSLLYAVAAVFVPLADRRVRLRRDVAVGFGWILVLARASPLSVEPVPLAAAEELLWLDSSAAGVVSVIQRGPHLRIRTDAHYDLGGTADAVHQERQGLVAALARPDASDALWIGSATGISAGALLARPLEALSLVEIQPAVALAGALFFSHVNRGVHEDARVRVVRDDARNFTAHSDEHFDLVVADLFVPWRAGTASLLGVDHFQAVRRRLRDDGAFVQWLPLYQLTPDAFASIAAGFADVFPRAAVFRGDFFGRFPIVALVGWNGAAPAAAELSGVAADLARQGERDRWLTDPIGVWSLYVGPLSGLSDQLAGARRQHDDRPTLETRTARARAAGEAMGVGEAWLEMATRIAAARESGDAIFPDLPDAARDAARAGDRLQAAGVAWVSGRPELAAARMLDAARDLPPSLLDPERPDPSAAELWPVVR